MATKIQLQIIIANFEKRIAELEEENADVYGMLDDIQNERLELRAEIAELKKIISLDVKLTELAVKKRIAGNKKQWEQARKGGEE